MGVLEDLAAALATQEMQKNLAAENPYLNLAAVPDAISQSALGLVAKAPGQYDMKEALLWGAGSGLLSGLLEGMGQDYQTTLSNRLQSALSSGLAGGSMDDAGYLPPSILTPAKQAASIFKLKQDLGNLESMREVALEGQKAYLGALGKARGEMAAYEMPAGGEGEGTIGAPAADPSKLLNPMLKEQSARGEARRKEFNALQDVKDFSTVLGAARALSGALQDQGIVSDQELVRYSILMIEPGMAVREGEQAAIYNSQSLPQQMKGELIRALNGESGLGETTRAGIRRLAERAYSAKESNYSHALSKYRDIAKREGINPEDIGYLGTAPSIESIFGPELKATQPTPGATASSQADDFAKMSAAINDPSVPLEMKIQLQQILKGMVPRG